MPSIVFLIDLAVFHPSVDTVAQAALYSRRTHAVSRPLASQAINWADGLHDGDLFGSVDPGPYRLRFRGDAMMGRCSFRRSTTEGGLLQVGF